VRLGRVGTKRDRDLQTKNTARIAVTGLGGTPLPALLLLENERAFQQPTSTLALSNEGDITGQEDPALLLAPSKPAARSVSTHATARAPVSNSALRFCATKR